MRSHLAGGRSEQRALRAAHALAAAPPLAEEPEALALAPPGTFTVVVIPDTQQYHDPTGNSASKSPADPRIAADATAERVWQTGLLTQGGQLGRAARPPEPGRRFRRPIAWVHAI